MCQSFYYFIFLWNSTCFGRHTAHHQEPKTSLAASGFSYVEGFWTCSWWTLSGTVCLKTSTNHTYKQPSTSGVLDPCIIAQFVYKNLSKCNTVSKFYYSIFIWSSTCFGRQTAHHQEPKTALAAYGFSYVEGCWTCSWWTLSGTVCLTTSTNYTSNNLPRMKNHQEPKTALASSGFSYVEGYWTCSWWTLLDTVCLATSTNYTSFNLPRMQN